MTQLSLPGITNGDSSEIFSVSINDAGAGLVGGRYLSGGQAYAAIVASNGAVTRLSLPNITAGDTSSIFSVSINESGTGLVGGISKIGGASGEAYAALVAANGTVTQLSLPDTSTNDLSYLNSVAINKSGTGLLGGARHSDRYDQGYAALVAANGTVTRLSLPNILNADSSEIVAVSLNDSGVGLVGGRSFIGGGHMNGEAYAALIAPNGTATQLPLPHIAISDGSIITSVSMNNAGVGLIGGQSITGLGGGEAYAVLVAPNGTVTQLSLPQIAVNDGSEILSVSLADTVPNSIGPYASAIYTQLAAARALETRLTFKGAQKVASSPTEVAAADLAPVASSPKTFPNCIWVAPFGNYVHVKSQGDIPTFTNTIGGLLVAYDRQIANFLVGGGAGYGYNGLHYSESLGHGSIQEEMLYAYMAYKQDRFRLNSAVWGGLYQFSNERHTIPLPGNTLTSHAHTHGWIFSPHLEMAFLWKTLYEGKYKVEPFFMFDYVNSWLQGYTEWGSSGLNLVVDGQYTSLLQSEAGLRFYEYFAFNWGTFWLEEKLSYVNQAPFYFNKATTQFVASASTFPVAVGSTEVQNLAGLELQANFQPKNQKMPYGGLTLQALLGPSYQSYFMSLEIGQNF